MRIAIVISSLLLSVSTLLAQDAGRSSDYLVGPRDVLDIRVFQDPSLNSQPRVSDDGKITLPLVGSINVSGITTQQIETKLKAVLEERYYSKADVTVSVLEFENAPILVLGSVNKPGKITVGGTMKLLQAISAAGGLAAGHGGSLFILRTASNGLSDQLEVDINSLIVQGDAEVNVPVEPNDLINVPQDVVLSIYVLGEVMKQGVVELRASQNATLLKAIVAAGGPTDRANLKRVIILRKEAGKETRIEVDFRRVRSGKSPDVTLRHDDRIHVPESFF